MVQAIAKDNRNWMDDDLLPHAVFTDYVIFHISTYTNHYKIRTGGGGWKLLMPQLIFTGQSAGVCCLCYVQQQDLQSIFLR